MHSLLFLKILFWLFVARSFCWMGWVIKDHPRKTGTMNIGGDVAVWIVSIATCIVLYYNCWGN